MGESEHPAPENWNPVAKEGTLAGPNILLSTGRYSRSRLGYLNIVDTTNVS